MSQPQNIDYILMCEHCQELAIFICTSCLNFYTCQAHKTTHCSIAQHSLSSVFKSPKNSLKSELLTLYTTINTQFLTFQKTFSQVQSQLNVFFNKAFTSFTNTLQELELSIGSFGDNNSILIRSKSFVQCLHRDDIQGLFIGDTERFVRKMESIMNVVMNKKNAGVGFEELHENCREMWEKNKGSIVAKDLDSFNDLVMELEDDLAKVMRKKIEVNSAFLVNSEFFKGLPGVCPNIYWVQGKVSMGGLKTLTEVLPYYQKLSVLELDILDNNNSQAIELLQAISKLPNLSNLALNGFNLSNLNNKSQQIVFPNLTICKISKNGDGNSDLGNFFKILGQSSDLRYLTIKNNTLLENNINQLIGTIDKWSKLRYLSISECKLDDSLEHLVRKLKSINRISEFHLKMNQTSSNTLKKIYSILNWNSLDRLVLGFGIDLDSESQLKSTKTRVFLQNNQFILNLI